MVIIFCIIYLIIGILFYLNCLRLTIKYQHTCSPPAFTEEFIFCDKDSGVNLVYIIVWPISIVPVISYGSALIQKNIYKAFEKIYNKGNKE